MPNLDLWTALPAVAGVVALVIAAAFYFRIKALPEDNADVARIGGYIREGAMAFLMREYKVLAGYSVVVFIGLTVAFKSPLPGAWFLLGAFLSLLAGFIGMKGATFANTRTALAAKSGIKGNALVTALDGGAVMGLCVAGLSLIGLALVYFVNRGDNHTLATMLHSFAVGASSIALFARIGGGIYTKAADVGADIAGKVIENIPEDDPRNPGVIADNVGDNVGDVAGMGADIYESLVAAIVATMAIGLTADASNLATLLSAGNGASEADTRAMAVALPLILAGIGLVVSILGIFITRAMKGSAPSTVLRAAMVLPPIVLVVVTAALLPSFGISQTVTVALAGGALGGAAIGLLTEYYTGHYGPVKAVAESAKTGAGTNVIRGMAVGMESVFWCLMLVAVVAMVANYAMPELGLYGIGLSAVGMLAGTAIVMTVDAYGPVADNAGGIAEMAGLPPEVREITDELDAVGNTTAAIGKGFAIGSATLTVMALFSAYSLEVKLEPAEMSIINPEVLIGVLIGAVLPFVVGGSTMLAVGKAAGAIVEEIRRQFDTIPGLREGKAEPQPRAIVDIATSAALSQMILPGVTAVLGPVVVGFALGPAALAGTLAGALAVGASMSLFMANAGGAWDNAKKYIEKGGLPGHAKRSDAHKAAVIGDTVGDPFKDTSGPGVSILIKVMSVVSLLIAPLLAAS